MLFSSRNKKKERLIFLLAFFIFSGVILTFTNVPSVFAMAGCSNDVLSEGTKKLLGCGTILETIGDFSGNIIVSGIQRLIYAIFLLFGVLVSVAITIFEWAINPKYISGPSGLLNLQAVYEMWQFIRDFLNLFFILVLLYIAFTVVFQVQKNFKSMLLSLVIAALLVNFSFPISRALIDATNVPMYFFTNQMMAGPGTGKIFGSALSASRLQGILIPGSEKGGTVNFQNISITRLLMATIFIFLFAITLLVLAIMFVIRLIVLMVLVIFSSVAFVASIVPGLDKYSKMWWENFWKYALFGPAAMLMLLIAVRFFAIIGNEQGATFSAIRSVAGDIVMKNDTNFIASLVMFSVPIILLWMTIGLGQKFAIIGGATISGYGQQFAKWAGKKMTYDNPYARGIRTGVAEKTGINKLKKWWVAPSKIEAGVKGGIIGAGTAKGIRGGAQSELDKIRHERAYQKVKEMKDTNVSNSELERMLRDKKADGTFKDVAGAEAAAMILSERKAIDTADDFASALQALGSNTKEVATLISNASSESLKFDSSTTVKADQFDKLFNSESFKINPKLREQFEKKIQKEGQTKTLIDYDINKTIGALSRQDAYDKYLGKMTAEEVAKVKGIHGDAINSSDAELINFVNQQKSTGNWTPKEHIDAYSKLNSEQKTAWRAAGINP